MKLTKRRVTVGLVSAAVVATMTGVSTWALAAENGTPAPTAGAVRLIVGYKNGVSVTSADSTLSASGARRTASGPGQLALDPLNATTIEVPKARSASLISTLRANPNVKYVEVDRERHAFDITPNDPAYVEGIQPEIDQVGLPKAWDTTTGSPATKIAVIDTGVNTVDDLSGQVLAGYDFVNNDASPADDEGHGTSVASLIAAKGNDGKGMAGVCWECKIIPVKVLNSKGQGNDSVIAKGITWAVQNGAKVINMSLGGDETSTVLSDAVAYANMNSVLVVAAAGNEGNAIRQYPAALTDVVSVAATGLCNTSTPNGCHQLTSFSSRNSSSDHWVDIAAPGIVTVMDNNGNVSDGAQGTSFASPIVAGIAGLIKSRTPNYTGWALMNAVQRSAPSQPVSGGGVNYGIVNAPIGFTVGTETVAPTSSGISPAQGAYVRGTFSVTPTNLKDNLSGIRNVVLYVDGVYKGYSRTAPFSVAYNSAGKNGVIRPQLRVYDKAGNLLTLDRALNADNVAPTVKITSAPKSGSKISGKVKIGYTGSDKYGVKTYQLLLNGKVAQTHTSVSAFVFAATAVKSGSTVQVRAYDKAGNSALSAKYTYKR